MMIGRSVAPTRVRHLRRLVTGWLLPVFGAGYTLIGLLTFVRDNLLSPQSRSRWDTFALLPHWSPSTWLAVALGVLALAFFEGSYRMEASSRREIEELARVDWAEFGDDFLLDNRARRSPVSHIAEVRQHFDALIADARHGDRVAAKRLLRVARKLDRVSVAAFATSPQFGEDVRRIQAAIEEFGKPGKV